MNSFREKSADYNKYLKNVIPIIMHPSYSRDLEFSDKIIVPISVKKELQRKGLPFPPLFILVPERSMYSCIYCSVLEFSAEEDYLYLPFWMISELGFKVLNMSRSIRRHFKTGYGVILRSLDLITTISNVSYAITKCSYVEYYCESDMSSEALKKELNRYCFIRENSEVSLCVNDSIISIKIVKVKPNEVSVINGDFVFNRLKELPVKAKVLKEENLNVEAAEIKTSVFPEYPTKLPKFLIEIIDKSKKTQISSQFKTLTEKDMMKSRKKYHRKNFSCIQAESPYIFQSVLANEDIEKYISGSSQINEIGKSFEDDITGILPPVYNTPNKTKIKVSPVLSITIPELTPQPQSCVKKDMQKMPKPKKKRSTTPLLMKNIKIDGKFGFISKNATKNG